MSSLQIQRKRARPLLVAAGTTSDHRADSFSSAVLVHPVLAPPAVGLHDALLAAAALCCHAPCSCPRRAVLVVGFCLCSCRESCLDSSSINTRGEHGTANLQTRPVPTCDGLHPCPPPLHSIDTWHPGTRNRRPRCCLLNPLGPVMACYVVSAPARRTSSIMQTGATLAAIPTVLA